MSPLKGAASAAASRGGQVDGLRAAELDVGARRVEMGVVRHDLAGTADDREEDLLGGPTLVRGDDVLEGEELLDRLEEPVPGRGPCVALVAVLDGGPLVAAHGAGAGVGQQVDDDVIRVQVEEVVARVLEGACRSARDEIRIGSTEWIRNGSMIVCQRSTAYRLNGGQREGPAACATGP